MEGCRFERWQCNRHRWLCHEVLVEEAINTMGDVTYSISSPMELLAVGLLAFVRSPAIAASSAAFGKPWPGVDVWLLASSSPRSTLKEANRRR